MSDTSIAEPINNAAALPFNYTSRDFESLLSDISRRMRSAIPGWDASPAAFEMILLEQFAYVGDILNFYIDRLAAEAYIQSAVLRESVLNLAYAFGYVPTAQSAASGTITFKKVTDDPITVPKGTQFYANAADTQVIFETTGDVYDSGLTDTVVALPAREGVTVTEESLGMSSGGERMIFTLHFVNVIRDSIEVSVAEGGIDSATGSPALISWEQIPRMIEADAADRVFSVYVNEVGVSIVRFGDGTTGRIPPTGAAIYATYRYGKGVLGNVAAGAIKSIVTGGAIAGQLKEITNPSPFAGGADAEPLESMRTNVPRSLRALDRAVTLQDFADLAIQVAGIAKAGAGAVLNTGVTLAVVGYDYSNVVADQTTLTSLTNFMNERKTIGTTLTIVGPTYKFVNVTAQINVNALYKRASVKADVEKAIANAFAFKVSDFGQNLSLGNLFAILREVPGVVTVAINDFYLQGGGVALNQNIALTYNEFPKPGTIVVSATGGIV